MLTEPQITRVWEHMLAAEIRALYFGDLAVTYTRRKQWLTGVSFVLSSSAFATIMTQAPSWVPAGFTLLAAVSTAAATAVNLDGQIVTLGKLYAAWHTLAAQYERLWDHTWADDADAELARLIEREREPSELAVASAPYDEARMGRWQDRVLELRHLKAPA